jgi:uracil-DNA glycosylase
VANLTRSRLEAIPDRPKTGDRPRARSIEYTSAPVPSTHDLERLRRAAKTCRACPLWRNATCTVFGTGPASARVVLVGEQPGDQEDRAGEPFVGPAGKLLDRALAAAGVERSSLYLTNAVKHFKWEPRGKRRLHQKPNARELAACRPWLKAELEAVKPALIVCLGATAARSVVGSEVRVMSERGRERDTEFGVPALITVHPSSLLRLPEGSDAKAAFACKSGLRCPRERSAADSSVTGLALSRAEGYRFGRPDFAPWQARGSMVTFVTMKSKTASRPPVAATKSRPPTHEQVEALARALWIDQGRPSGHDLEIWLTAERQLIGAPLGNGEDLDPETSRAARVDRELERIVSPPPQRSPTAL